jgi:di- and tripeptidase
MFSLDSDSPTIRLCAAIPTSSLRRDLRSETSEPHLLHSLHEQRSSVLSLAASDEYIFSGNQNREVVVSTTVSLPDKSSLTGSQVWDKQTFTLKKTLHGHMGSVLALEYACDKQWLFSASGMYATALPPVLSD